jgi:hypothetical protein
MTIVKPRPTSPGRRGVVKVVSPELYKGDPYEPLLESKNKSAGRNNSGRITVRHRGGGSRQRYRVIDFKRNKDGIPAKVERIEYDPNRTANIALILYSDGERRYIIAPNGIQQGSILQSEIHCLYEIFLLVQIYTALNCSQVKVHSWPEARERVYNWSLEKVLMLLLDYVQEKCAKYLSIVELQLEKLVMVSIVSENLVRRVLNDG